MFVVEAIFANHEFWNDVKMKKLILTIRAGKCLKGVLYHLWYGLRGVQYNVLIQTHPRSFIMPNLVHYQFLYNKKGF